MLTTSGSPDSSSERSPAGTKRSGTLKLFAAREGLPESGVMRACWIIQARMNGGSPITLNEDLSTSPPASSDAVLSVCRRHDDIRRALRMRPHRSTTRATSRRLRAMLSATFTRRPPPW